jgi:hypothetical protein
MFCESIRRRPRGFRKLVTQFFRQLCVGTADPWRSFGLAAQNGRHGPQAASSPERDEEAE